MKKNIYFMVLGISVSLFSMNPQTNKTDQSLLRRILAWFYIVHHNAKHSDFSKLTRDEYRELVKNFNLYYGVNISPETNLNKRQLEQLSLLFSQELHRSPECEDFTRIPAQQTIPLAFIGSRIPVSRNATPSPTTTSQPSSSTSQSHRYSTGIILPPIHAQHPHAQDSNRRNRGQHQLKRSHSCYFPALQPE